MVFIGILKKCVWQPTNDGNAVPLFSTWTAENMETAGRPREIPLGGTKKQLHVANGHADLCNLEHSQNGHTLSAPETKRMFTATLTYMHWGSRLSGCPCSIEFYTTFLSVKHLVYSLRPQLQAVFYTVTMMFLHIWQNPWALQKKLERSNQCDIV